MNYDNRLFNQSREKELINRGGENISPREIDDVLLAHPAIQQAVTFAIPNPTLGEDVAAAVVLRQNCIVSIQALRQFAASRLADFKVPSQIIILNELPKDPTGKIQRVGLAEILKTELGWSMVQEVKGTAMPSTPMEKELLSIWQRVLNLDQIGVQDDLLAMGGDSIKAASILMYVDEYFKVTLSLGEIFMAPTIAAMAQMISERRSKGENRE